MFYQLCRGAPDELRAKYSIEGPERYYLLTRGRCTVVSDEVNDVSCFLDLCASMTIMGVSAEDMDELWKLLAVMLHLGNLSVRD